MFCRQKCENQYPVPSTQLPSRDLFENKYSDLTRKLVFLPRADYSQLTTDDGELATGY